MGKYHRPESLRHLVRLEGEGFDGRPGWQLRVPAWFPNGPWTEFFADADLGGQEPALAAARVRRDALFGHEELPLRLPYMPQTAKCISGMTGVFVDHRRARGGGWRWRWCAAWMSVEKGRRVVRGFNINRLGFLPALEQAINERCRQTGMPKPDAGQRKQLVEYGQRKMEEIESLEA